MDSENQSDQVILMMHQQMQSRYRVTSGSRNDEPEAVLEGVAMAGFVRILRQLGDLTELAAEVFHDLHDQVMAASARAHHITIRAQQLEAELPRIDEDFCPSQQHHCLHAAAAASNMDRVDWRADVQVKLGTVAGGGGRRRPPLILQFIKRCRGPPKLSMLDKFDAGGEGACLKRYTDPSFFRTDDACATKLLQEKIYHRPKLSPQILENRPNSQSSENSNPPKADHTCSKSETDASDKASDGLLSMLRQQLKYRQTNGPFFRIMKPQMHNFHHDASSEEKASATQRSESEVNMSSTNSPESSIQVTDIAVGAASVDEEKKCDLERTNSFEAWLSPDARTPDLDITEETSQDSSDGSVSHATSNGTFVGNNKAVENPKSNTAEVSYKKGVSKRSRYKGSVEFIASRVRNLPRKLSANKHDPLADSFRKMAKKLFELKVNAIRDNESYDLEPDRECHETSQSNLDETEEERNAMEKVPSESAWHVHDPCKRQPAQTNSSDALDHELMDKPVHTMKVFYKFTSEDVPGLDEVALDDNITEYLQEQVISEKSDDPCDTSRPASIDENASDSITSCNPETVPKETTMPMLVTNPVFSCDTSLPDCEQCHLYPETTRLKSTRGPSYDASVEEDKQILHQPIIHQEQNGCTIPYECSSRTGSPGTCRDSTDTGEMLSSRNKRSSRCRINEAVHEPTNVLPENAFSEDTKDVTVPLLPPIPPMQWLSVKVHTGSGISSPKLGTIWQKSPVINRAAKSNSLQPVRKHKTEVSQASSQHSNWTSQTNIAQTLVFSENANADKFHTDGVGRYSILDMESKENSHRESFRKSPVLLSEGKTLKTLKFPELIVHSDEVISELAEINTQPQEIHLQQEGTHRLGSRDPDYNDMHLSDLCTENLKGERKYLYRNAAKISAVHGNILPVSEVNKLNGDQVHVQNSPSCQSNEERGSNLHEQSVFFSAVEQLRKISPPSVPRPKYSLLEVVSHDRSMSFNLNPVLGRSSNAMVSPTNSKVSTIFQRADGMHQARANNDNIDSEETTTISTARIAGVTVTDLSKQHLLD